MLQPYNLLSEWNDLKKGIRTCGVPAIYNLIEAKKNQIQILQDAFLLNIVPAR
jgi:hypothetical protein